MVSALSRKSITDLSRHRSRTFFSVVTLALAVASIGLLALPNLMNRAMDAAVASDRLPDVTVYTRPLRLDGAIEPPAELATEAVVNSSRPEVTLGWIAGEPRWGRPRHALHRKVS